MSRLRYQHLDGRQPPTFEESKNKRQRARAAGLHPDYWYAVEYDEALKPGETKEVTFWGQSIALFRTEKGELGAIENRCAHRQVKLTLGEVSGCNLVCPYHGWEYGADGCVKHIPHELFGREMPKFRVHRYPLRVRYGLIFLFPGDPELAEKVPMPEIPELEGSNRWSTVHIDYLWKAHHTMIIENVCDFTHEYLHRKTKPFVGAKLTRCEREGDKVHVSYEAAVGASERMKPFVDDPSINLNHIDLCYDYPYQSSSTGGTVKHFLFALPVDRETTRVFFVFYFRKLKVPFLPVHIPRWLMEPVMRWSKMSVVHPILAEDGWVIEAEQEGFNRCFDSPLAELNPVVHEFQKLTIEKWQEHMDAQEKGKKRSQKDAPAA